MTEIGVSILVGVSISSTIVNLIILALNFKLYTEFFKERVKGK